ncbi:Uu.00g142400.m01.CDS01 [Anthostomella pinea]|uniref:Uu.00g142400.m01.CDS01 n=1 Tax=Anthostomella pinea TaxID=933095 RepID=A0AAI8YLL2_9PEZI|nr:Uu.00g142400.m01.CDS01 [Anthostomella pinea]
MGPQEPFHKFLDAYRYQLANSDLARRNYGHQALGYAVRTQTEGRDATVMKPPQVAAAEFRSLVQERGDDYDTAAVQAEAVKRAKAAALDDDGKGPTFPYSKPILGYALQCVSELGSEASCVANCGTPPSTSTRPGGLFCPRNDMAMDADCDWTRVAPSCGNAAAGYARLNVVDGQKKMWEAPWTRDRVGVL